MTKIKGHIIGVPPRNAAPPRLVICPTALGEQVFINWLFGPSIEDRMRAAGWMPGGKTASALPILPQPLSQSPAPVRPSADPDRGVEPRAIPAEGGGQVVE